MENDQTTKETIASVLRDTQNTAGIMRELSDLKSALAVNNNETTNIKNTLNDVKSDIKEIKSDFVSHREFNEKIIEIQESISPLKKLMYGLMATIGIAVIGALLKLILRV